MMQKSIVGEYSYEHIFLISNPDMQAAAEVFVPHAITPKELTKTMKF